MEPTKDIYHKEVIPFLGRRKKRQGRHRRESISAASMEAAPVAGAPAVDPSSNRFRSRRTIHHNRRAASTLNKAVWILIGGSVVVYLAVLGLSFVAHGKFGLPKAESTKPAEPPKQPEPAKEAPVRVEPQDASVSASLLNDIRGWSEAQSLVEEGARLRLNKQTDRAQQKLEQALALAPSLADAHMELAELYAAALNFPEAEKHLSLALAVSPGQIRGRQLLAMVLASQGKYEASLAAARWMLQSEPYSTDAHQLSATAYFNLGQPAAAIDHLRKIVNVNRQDLIAQNMLAQAYTRLGQHEKALGVLREIQVLDPANAMAYYNLAVCYAQQSLIQETLDTLTHAAALFDRQFVLSWMESKEFDPIRADPLFAAFRDDMKKDATTPAEGDAKVEAAATAATAEPPAAAPAAPSAP